MDLRLLGKQNFATAVTFSFILGMVLNGSTILLPQFLQNDLGYTAQQAGMALSPGGIALAFMIPIAGILTIKSILGSSSLWVLPDLFRVFHVTNIYLGVSFNTMVAYRVIQCIGIPLIFIPISTLNYSRTADLSEQPGRPGDDLPSLPHPFLFHLRKGDRTIRGQFSYSGLDEQQCQVRPC